MHIQWFGQSSFRVRGESLTIIIDPFGDMTAAGARGLEFNYPPLTGETADLVLVTHEHFDHNGVGAVGGDPAIVRSTPGRHASAAGEVLGVASEHDEAAGTERGANTIFVLSIDGLRIAHFGDFGQRNLRDEQAQAIGQVDLAFLPVGGGPTISGEAAAEIATQIGARWVVPMHYRTPRINFLDTADAFLDALPHVWRAPGAGFDTAELPADAPLAVVPAVP